MRNIRYGKRLKELRGMRKQLEVAAALGVGQAAISMYENGRRVPNDRAKEALAKYFGVDVGELFFAQENTDEAKKIERR